MQDDKVKAEIALAWKVLYDKPYDEIPDPNDPANTARLNAMKKMKQDAMKRFFDGPGKPIIDDWQKEIQATNLFLLFAADVSKCSCDACLRIRDIRNKLVLMQSIKQSLEKEKV
jgi:hypothetical protein